MPRVLTIAGSDSSGGAGIEADLKTFTVHGCYGMTCITGLTAQNTLGVRQIYPIASQSMIRNTLEAVFEDIGVDVVKTGMLTSSETVETVAKVLERLHPGKPVVVDPVMVSTSGSHLIDNGAIRKYVEELIPLATLITPNLHEARALCETAFGEYDCDAEVDVEHMKLLARRLHTLGSKAVLVKGGHRTGADHKVIDVLYDGDRFYEFASDRIDSKSTHGTGCTLASAIASNLAQNKDLKLSIKRAIQFVHRAIETASPLGKGYGPVNHLHNIHTRPFVSGHFIDYLLSHPKVKPIWQQYVNHPFVQKLGRDELDLDSFKFFLVQDYLYLRHYARCHALAGFKAQELDVIAKSAQIVLHIQEEIKMHIEYCESFGITKAHLESSKESMACFAYSRYILDVGSQQDWLALQVALSPCLFGYLEAAKIILDDPLSKQGNRYWRWVTNYVSPAFVEAVHTGKELLESHITHVSPQRIEECVDIFATATQMECEFWTSALNKRLRI